MTECTQSQFEFEAHFSRRVVAEFSGERLTTEGGSLLLRAADRKIGLRRRVVRCFTDARDPQRIEHALSEMLAQRIYGLALGYEDLNDHEELRNDPLLGMLVGRRDPDAPLAGKSTLNRLELTPSGSPLSERYHKISYSAEALDALLVDLFLEAHARAPREIVLDLDATDTPLHGRQEARFFHGYYGHYYYCRCICSAEIICCAHDCGPRTSTRAQEVWKKCNASCGRFARGGRTCASSCERTRASAARNCWRGAKNTRWTAYSASRGTSACDGSSAGPCTRPSKSTGTRKNRRGCSVSSPIARRKVGRERGAWWPRRNRSRARKIPATWSSRWAQRPGPRGNSTSSSTAPVAKWKTASRNS